MVLHGWSIILYAIGILALGLGLLVGARDWRKPVNLSFMALSIAVSLWVIGIAGFLSVSSDTYAFFFAKLFYVAPLLLVLALTYFTYLFPFGSALPLRVWLPPAIPTIGLVLLLCLWPEFVKHGINQHDWGKEVVVNHMHDLVYTATGIMMFGVAFR